MDVVDLVLAENEKINFLSSIDDRFVPNIRAGDRLQETRICPELVVFGDNPGDSEWRTNDYLAPSGKAGRICRDYLQYTMAPEGTENKVLFWNKSSYYTPRTEDLEKVYAGLYFRKKGEC